MILCQYNMLMGSKYPKRLGFILMKQSLVQGHQGMDHFDREEYVGGQRPGVYASACHDLRASEQLAEADRHVGVHIPSRRSRAHLRQATSFLSRGSMVCGRSVTPLSTSNDVFKWIL